jgi:hypothetical protein
MRIFLEWNNEVFKNIFNVEMNIIIINSKHPIFI